MKNIKYLLFIIFIINSDANEINKEYFKNITFYKENMTKHINQESKLQMQCYGDICDKINFDDIYCENVARPRESPYWYCYGSIYEKEHSYAIVNPSYAIVNPNIKCDGYIKDNIEIISLPSCRIKFTIEKITIYHRILGVIWVLFIMIFTSVFISFFS